MTCACQTGDRGRVAARATSELAPDTERPRAARRPSSLRRCLSVDLLVLGAMLLVVCGAIAASGLRAADSWVPVSDNARIAVDAAGVASGDLPLLGAESTSLENLSGVRPIHHLGPAETYVLGLWQLVQPGPGGLLVAVLGIACTASITSVLAARAPFWRHGDGARWGVVCTDGIAAGDARHRRHMEPVCPDPPTACGRAWRHGLRRRPMATGPPPRSRLRQLRCAGAPHKRGRAGRHAAAGRNRRPDRRSASRPPSSPASHPVGRHRSPRHRHRNVATSLHLGGGQGPEQPGEPTSRDPWGARRGVVGRRPRLALAQGGRRDPPRRGGRRSSCSRCGRPERLRPWPTWPGAYSQPRRWWR